MPKFSMRLIQYNVDGPIQINLVCVNCHDFIPSQNLYDIERWIHNHKCPTVIPIMDAEGNVNPSHLFAELEKRHQL